MTAPRDRQGAGQLVEGLERKRTGKARGWYDEAGERVPFLNAERAEPALLRQLLTEAAGPKNRPWTLEDAERATGQRLQVPAHLVRAYVLSGTVAGLILGLMAGAVIGWL